MLQQGIKPDGAVEKRENALRWLVPFAKPKPRNALTPGKKHFRRKAEPKVVRTVTLPYVTRDRCCSSKGLGWPRRLPILID